MKTQLSKGLRQTFERRKVWRLSLSRKFPFNLSHWPVTSDVWQVWQDMDYHIISPYHITISYHIIIICHQYPFDRLRETLSWTCFTFNTNLHITSKFLYQRQIEWKFDYNQKQTFCNQELRIRTLIQNQYFGIDFDSLSLSLSLISKHLEYRTDPFCNLKTRDLELFGKEIFYLFWVLSA